MRSYLVAVVCSVVALGACGSGDDSVADMAEGDEADENLGTATFQLMTVPSGVGCLRMSVSGTSSLSRDFPLMTGAATGNLSMNRLPLGAVTINGLAYATTCGAGDAIYIADTVTTVLAAGVASKVPLTFRKNNPVTASVNFVGNVQGLSASGIKTSAIIDGAVYAWGISSGNTPAKLDLPIPASILSTGSVADGWCSKSEFLLRCFGENKGNMWGNIGNWSDGVTYTGFGNYEASAIGDMSMCVASPSTQSVYCSGGNAFGQLGTSVPAAGSSTPIVTWTKGVASLTAGSDHFCLVDSQLNVQCIGRNDWGQLGDGSQVHRSSWLTPLRGARSVAAGLYHSCALLTDNTLKCWGMNSYGQLGDGTLTQRSTAVTVSGIAGVTKVVAGAGHTCALQTDGVLKCWGSNASGSLGDGSVKDRLVPVQVPLPDSVIDVSAGSSHTCAVTKRQDIYCWGDNFYGQLGDGSFTSSATPVRVVLP